MGVTEDRGRFYFVMRVPKRYQNIDTRSQVRQALHTDSRSAAIRKAPAIEEQFVAYWEDLLTGNDADAKSRWDTARRLAASKGFVYKPIEDLASGPIEELLARLEAVSLKGELALLLPAPLLKSNAGQPGQNAVKKPLHSLPA